MPSVSAGNGTNPSSSNGRASTASRIGCSFLLVMVTLATAFALMWTVDRVRRTGASTLVRVVLIDQANAWNRGDLEGFMQGYWNSDELTFYSGGTVTKGWQATLDRYRKRYQADGKEMGSLEFAIISVDVPSRETAVVRGRWKVVTSKESSEGLFTLLFREIDGKWVIVHDHTSAADPPKPAEPERKNP